MSTGYRGNLVKRFCAKHTAVEVYAQDSVRPRVCTKSCTKRAQVARKVLVYQELHVATVQAVPAAHGEELRI